jgi:hypothetical protein
MELIFLWAFFAVVCAIIANNKNRSGVIWAILGLIGGVFAIIIVALLPKVEAA